MAVNGSGALILVADEDEEALEMACVRLERLGHRTLRAGDGAKALALARMKSPDLCVLDVGIPKPDGLGVLRALREDERTAEIPVILVTATDAERDRGQVSFLEPGAFLSKPFDPAELRHSVEWLLRDG